MKNPFVVCLALTAALACAVPSSFGQSAQASGEPGMLLSRDGRAQAVIVVSGSAPEEVRRGAGELRDYLARITGGDFPVTAPEALDAHVGAVRIHVGLNDSVASELRPDLSRCELDGAWIRTVSPRDLLIAGRTPHGTEFGVYGFLERFCGVRWYLPGPDGTHVPRAKTLALPAIDLLDNPAFISRAFWSPTLYEGSTFACGAAQAMDQAWYRHNRMRRNLKAHHNLGRIIVPSKYGAEHPEYFPEIGGVRRVPKTDRPVGFQPCMSNDEVVRICAEAAARHFDEHPDDLTFDMGVNDHGGFCECAACTVINGPPRYNTRGLPEFSRLYLTFANRVAAALPERHRDRYLGVLAYAQVRDLPEGLDLHPNLHIARVGAFVCYFNPMDRADMQTTLRFAERCRMFSVYDYWYGSGYAIPNFGVGLMEEYVDRLAAAGAKGWACEVYHQNWSMDGIKYRLLARKLWEPPLRVQDLLAEFCTDLFGRGAPAMMRYYDLCRERWERQTFATSKYHLRGSGRQLALFDAATCGELERLLGQAEAATENPAGRNLLASFRKTLAFTSLCAAMQGSGLELVDGERVDLDARAPGPHQETLAHSEASIRAPGTLPADAALAVLAGLQNKEALLNALGNDPFTFPRSPLALPGGLFHNPETVIAPMIAAPGAAEAEHAGKAVWLDRIRKEVPQYAGLAEWLDANLEKMDREPELLPNGDFERLAADRHNAEGWAYGNWGSSRSTANAFVTPQGVDGGQGYYLAGIKNGFTYQPYPVIRTRESLPVQAGGWYLLRFWIRSHRNDGLYPDLSASVDFEPAAAGSVTCPVPPGFRWFQAVRLFQAPPRATRALVRVLLNGEGQAWVDRVSLKVVPAAFAPAAPDATAKAAVMPALPVPASAAELPTPFILDLQDPPTGVMLRGGKTTDAGQTVLVTTNDYIVAQVPWFFNSLDHAIEVRVRVSGSANESMRVGVLQQFFDGRDWQRTPGVAMLGRVKIEEEPRQHVFRYAFEEPWRKVQILIYRANQKGTLRLHALEIAPVLKAGEG